MWGEGQDQSYDKAIKKDERRRMMWMKKRENKRGRCLMTETMRNTKELNEKCFNKLTHN